MGATRSLRPYQSAIARAVLDSVLHRRGLTFTVEIAEHGGGRELSAQLELALLALHTQGGGRVVKVAPGVEASGRDRLVRHLAEGRVQELWSQEATSIRVGRAEQLFLTPEQARTLQNPLTLLEVAGAQEMETEAYYRYLSPLAEESGATVVLYGTPWNGETWFERMKQRNRELAGTDGRQRHFRVPWQEVARHFPLYAHYVGQRRSRMGEDHPWFQTRYKLRPVPVAGPLLSEVQRRGIQGLHARRRTPGPGVTSVASVQVHPVHRQRELSASDPWPGRDITALVTLAEVSPSPSGTRSSLRIVDHRWWQATTVADVAAPLAGLLRDDWRCRRVVMAPPPGHGELVAQLQQALPTLVVDGYTPSPEEESALTMALLAAAGTRRLELYAADGSPEYRAMRHELESARAVARLGGLLSMEVQPPVEGFLRGMLLVQRAAMPPANEESWSSTAALAS